LSSSPPPHPALFQIASSPDFYPQALDPVADRAWFIRLSRQQYEDASFLDERVMSPGESGEWAPVEAVGKVVSDLPERCHFIFHIGHVGSTLLSRLLGALPGLFSLREPTALPVLAHLKSELGKPEALWSSEVFEARLSQFLKLWSRTYAPDDRAVVKATSWASEIAADLLTRPYRPRAVLMSVQPDVFLAGVMASAGGWEDVSNAAQASMRRLHTRLGETAWTLHRMSPGERIAMSWACEMTALTEARRVAGPAAMWLDFETFLAAPDEGLTAAARHLGHDPDPGMVQALVTGPIMTRYSKLPTVGFDKAFRHRVLARARQDHAVEIAAGLAWLDDASRRFPMIAEARNALAA
jgi:hypothetical protein